VDRIALDRDLLARMLRRRLGYSRRDIHNGPALRRRGPATESESGVARA